jgi:carboxyl-terminal processing protease
VEPGAQVDPVVRAVLALVEQRYLEPRRIDPAAMLAAAREVAERALGVQDVLELAPAAGVGASLAPPLEAALAAVGPAGRSRARALLLDACLRRLDPFSRALAGEPRRRHEARFHGVSGGVGVRIGRRDGRIVVLDCRADSPARAAGLAPGDEIVAVDDVPVTAERVGTIAARLQGRPGTAVAITVAGRPRPLRAVRGTIAIDTIRAATGENGVVVLAIAHVARRTPLELDRRLAETGAALAPSIEIDLRGNSGGSMLAAAAIADRFCERGVLLEALDREGRPVPGLRSRVEATPGALGVPLVVRVDAGTGSSAELLAAALAWSGRAALFGGPTRGKNYVQSLHHWPEADLTVRLSAAYLHTQGRRLPACGLGGG